MRYRETIQDEEMGIIMNRSNRTIEIDREPMRLSIAIAVTPPLDRWQQARISRHTAKVKDGRKFLWFTRLGLVKARLDVGIVQGREQNLKWGGNF